jgi:hypothetical protein
MINEPPFVNDFGRPSRFMLVLRPLASMIRGIVRLRPPRRVIHIEFNGEDGNHTRELKRRGCSSAIAYIVRSTQTWIRVRRDH